MLSIDQKRVEKIIIFLSYFFIFLAVIGAFRSYSPIPYGDMWNGYLDFYVKASSGDWSSWWSQHNEHRILLSRIFFWIDLKYFEGAGWFLILVNYFLLGSVGFIFSLFLKERLSKKEPFIQMALLGWISFWAQKENLIWGFQSQFLLAYMLPLASFYFLHQSETNSNYSNRYFFFSIFFGFLSIGSMANGVLVLPLLVLSSFMLDFSIRRKIILISLCLLSIWCYLHEYVPPNGHGSFILELQQHPSGLILYALTYLGNPFFYIFGKGQVALLISQFFGLVFLGYLVVYFWKFLRTSKVNSFELAILLFILYVFGTALITAGGRLIFGISQATESRYVTPSLLAWSAMFVLFVRPALATQRKLFTLMCLGLLLLMMPYQLKVIKSKSSEIFEYKVAALALELGVQDHAQIKHIFPFPDWGLELSKEPVKRNLSVFGIPPYRQINKMMGKKIKLNSTMPNCLGNLDFVEKIPEDANFLRLSGWAFEPTSKRTSQSFVIVNSDGSVVGYVLSGRPRKDLSESLGPEALNSGFQGYLSISSGSNQFLMISDDGSCQIKIKPNFIIKYKEILQ